MKTVTYIAHFKIWALVEKPFLLKFIYKRSCNDIHEHLTELKWV